MSRVSLALLLCLIAPSAIPVARAADAALYVGFWNVENLFDTVDDPKVELDEEYTPAAPKNWTDARLQHKLNNLAKVIREMNGGRGPDALGLAEVENRRVIEMLIEKLKPLNRTYQIVHQDSPSARGIDCALIYDAAALTLADQPAFHFVPETRDTRDVVEAQFTRGDHRLTIFVNHWPSRGGDKDGAGRISAAKVVRKRVDALLAADPAADFIIIGDLNDYPTDRSVREYLRAVGPTVPTTGPAALPTTLPPGALFNSTEVFHDGKRGSSWYQGRWDVIDHVILSPGLLDERGFRWRPNSTEVIRKDYQLFRPNTPQARPDRTYGGDGKYHGGYSDHMPVGCVVEVR